MKRLSLFLMIWLILGILPLVRATKGQTHILGYWPMLAAYLDLRRAWPIILTHLFASAGIFAVGVLLYHWYHRKTS